MAKTTDPAALDDWYVVASSTEIPPGGDLMVKLLGQPVRLERDAAGALRGAEIDSAGSETEIPAHSLQERYSFVWLTFGRPARGIPEIPEFAEEGRRHIPRGRIGVATSGQRVIENFVDLSHFSFVHTGTLGGYDDAEVPRYKVALREDGAELWATECRFFQPKASAAAAGGADITYNYRVTSPFNAIIYKDSLVRPGKADLMCLFVQPEEETVSVAHTYTLVHDETNSDTHLLHFYHEIFNQDRAVLIQQRPKKLPVGPRQEIPTISDAMSIAYRRWLAQRGLRFGIEATPD